MFDEENLISLDFFLSFCLSTYVQCSLKSSIAMSQPIIRTNLLNGPFFREIFVFYFAKSSFFEIFFFAKFLHFLVCENFEFFAKQIEAKFREKIENFRERTNELRNFRKTIFLSCWKVETLILTEFL